MGRGLTKWAVGMMLVFAGSSAWAAGSLAIDSLQGKEYGFSFNHPTYGVSDERAKRECGADCSIVKRFENQCAAYAADQTSGSTVYGWGYGGTSAVVQKKALAECREQGGASCIVRAWGCDTIKAADKPIVPKNPKQASNAFTMLGEWAVDYTTARGYSANGVLRVTEPAGNGAFRGVLVLSFASMSGEMKKIQEEALITVQGETITISGSNPVFLVGEGRYNADNYTTTIVSSTVLKGVNRDNAGAGGIIVLIKK